MHRPDNPEPRHDVRWFHQSWAVIGGLLLVAGFFVFSFGSTVFLAALQILVVAVGLWLFFGMSDRSLTSDRPAILEMRDWWRRRRHPQLPRRLALPGPVEPSEGTSRFLYVRAREEPLDTALARSLEEWGELVALDPPADDNVEAWQDTLRDLADRARAVSSGSSRART